MHVYGTADLARLLGISAASVRSLLRAGHVRPRKGARGRLQFSFQDLIVLRTARSLTGARVPARRLNRSLRQLRAALPSSVPLSGLSITAIGDQVAVREGRQHWDTESGQYLLALEVSLEGGEVRLIDRDVAAAGRPTNADASVSADQHYDDAYELEASDPVAAIAAYERCLASHKGHAEARLNCGRLLHLAGRLGEAERMYRDSDGTDAALLFNLGVLLEDLGREQEAMQTYRQVLERDPGFADAHFNLSRLHELAGNRRESFRHLLAYKRASD
jgi:tetratricopeptide (TPR) repeat protein